jgi:hypothetical protein
MWSKKWYLKRNISCDVQLLNELLEMDVAWDDDIVVSAGKLRKLWDSVSELRSSACERGLERTVVRPALLPVKTAQFTQFFHNVWRHTIKSLSLTGRFTEKNIPSPSEKTIQLFREIVRNTHILWDKYEFLVLTAAGASTYHWSWNGYSSVNFYKELLKLHPSKNVLMYKGAQNEWGGKAFGWRTLGNSSSCGLDKAGIIIIRHQLCLDRTI